MTHNHDSYMLYYDIRCMIGCFNIQKSSTNLQIKYSSPVSLFDRLIYLLCQTLYHDMADCWHGCQHGWLFRCIEPRALTLQLFFHRTYLMNERQNQLKQILLFTLILEGNCRLVSLPLYQRNFVCVITFALNVCRVIKSVGYWFMNITRLNVFCMRWWKHCLEYKKRLSGHHYFRCASERLTQFEMLSQNLSVQGAFAFHSPNQSKQFTSLSEASVKYLHSADV